MKTKKQVARRRLAKHDGGSKKGRGVGKKKSALDLTTYSGRIGNAVCLRRTKLGMTVEKLQERLRSREWDVSPQTIYAWEAGTRPIPLNALPDIADALDTTLRKLLPES